jgi:endonuclease YncB( thermonuclease family)
MAVRPWTVLATVVRVIDGDTVVVDLDLGWRVYRNREHIRVFGIYAPERGTKEAIEATLYARTFLRSGAQVKVVSEAKPSFERTVGRILVDVAGIEWDFADLMVEAGHAERVVY